LAFLYNSDYERGVPHPPQNFASGFSGFPQLSQNADVSFFSAGFCLAGFSFARYFSSYSSRSCLAGFDVFDPLLAAAMAPIIPPIATTPITM